MSGAVAGRKFISASGVSEGDVLVTSLFTCSGLAWPVLGMATWPLDIAAVCAVSEPFDIQPAFSAMVAYAMDLRRPWGM